MKLSFDPDLSGVKTPIRRVALTGSMASGKSTAAAAFRDNGVTVVDADELARRVVEPGSPALDEIARAFGKEILTPAGELDREALGREVFSGSASSDAEGGSKKKKRLEAILHPRIRELADEELARGMKDSAYGFAVYDVPLLFEGGLEGDFDLVVTVFAEREQLLDRGASRTGLSVEEVEARLSTQLNLEDKARRSHVVLDNRGDRADLADQVSRLCALIAAHNGKAAL